MMVKESTTLNGAAEWMPPEDRLAAVLQHGKRLTVEEVLQQIPEMSWSQLFLAMDILSRRGDIELRRQGFTYTVRMVHASTDVKRGEDGAAHRDHR